MKEGTGPRGPWTRPHNMGLRGHGASGRPHSGVTVDMTAQYIATDNMA